MADVIKERQMILNKCRKHNKCSLSRKEKIDQRGYFRFRRPKEDKGKVRFSKNGFLMPHSPLQKGGMGDSPIGIGLQGFL